MGWTIGFQSGFGAHPAFYPVDNGSSLFGIEAGA